MKENKKEEYEKMKIKKKSMKDEGREFLIREKKKEIT
jgi:hypothetical protein